MKISFVKSHLGEHINLRFIWKYKVIYLGNDRVSVHEYILNDKNKANLPERRYV